MVKKLTTMSDVREPFNLTEDSSRAAELLAVGSGEHALGEYSVHVEGPGGASGLASVQADGSFSFTGRKVRPSNSMPLECTCMQGRRRLDYPTWLRQTRAGAAGEPRCLLSRLLFQTAHKRQGGRTHRHGGSHAS